MRNSVFPFEKVFKILELDHFLFAFGVFILCYVFYKLFLKKISEKRHESLKLRFKSTLKFSIISFTLAFILALINKFAWIDLSETLWGSYFVLIILIISTITLVKIAQVMVYQYLFFSNMSHGVPRLIANMFTFFFSIILIHLMASHVFEIQLSALLATSAVFSLVLGLALQDTLGNLFSGLSLQIESPFEIGDWIEVDGKQKQWLGQVVEINWRATFLMSFMDELIMIPNKTIAQSEILIISQGKNNIRLSHTLRLSYDADIDFVKKIILSTLEKIDGISKDHPIRLLITDTQESYFVLKTFYSLDDFQKRYRLGDVILSEMIKALKVNNIKLQTQQIELVK